MKTTIEIPDALANEARCLAAREKTTLGALIETGLQRLLEERQTTTSSFRLRDGSFGGRGLQAEFRSADWQRIREATYEGRGG